MTIRVLGRLKQTSTGVHFVAILIPVGNKTKAGFGNRDIWLVKIDASGSKQWEQVFGGSAPDYANSIQETSDGGFIIGGKSDSSISGNKTTAGFGDSDGWLIRTDRDGNKQWEQAFGGAAGEEIWGVRQVRDGGYLLNLHSPSGVNGNKTAELRRQ